MDQLDCPIFNLLFSIMLVQKLLPKIMLAYYKGLPSQFFFILSENNQIYSSYKKNMY